MKYKVGLGYDVHRLSEGEELKLGGIKIEHHKGTVGHSDADALTHAICDALLGAANLRDIGFQFPNSDPKFKGIDSKFLLLEVIKLLETKNYKVGNVDATIILQEPKISKYIPKMKESLASVLKVSVDDISIKATTSEKMGFVGREEGVMVQAVAFIAKIISESS